MSEALREKLQLELAVVEWREVRAHAARDAVIVVDTQLDLVDVALAVAGDDSACVAAWIAEGRLGKPGAEDLTRLETRLDQPFRLLIARPFLLVQEATDAPAESTAPSASR